MALALWAALATPALADTVGIELYRARLAAAREALRSAQLTGADPIALVGEARALLRQTTAVRLLDGTEVLIDDRPLADRLSTDAAQIERAMVEIDALARYAARPASATVHEAADARLRELVAQHGAAAQPTLSTLLADLLRRFLSGLGGAPPDLRIPLVAVGGTGLALLLVILAILGRGLRERFRREVLLPELRAARATEPAQYLLVADQALAQGRLRDGIHALYLYALHALASRQAIRYDPSLTDRELLAHAAAIPEADALRDLVGLHDRVWYGLRDARTEEAALARRLALRAAP